MDTVIGNVSDGSWNAARHALSRGFTVPISLSAEAVSRFAKGIDDITAYGFAFATWPQFVMADKPEGLFDRAAKWKGNHPSDDTFVIYDPLDDERGFLYVGADPIEIVSITSRYIIDQEPDEGPLSVDGTAQSVVENA